MSHASLLGCLVNLRGRIGRIDYEDSEGDCSNDEHEDGHEGDEGGEGPLEYWGAPRGSGTSSVNGGNANGGGSGDGSAEGEGDLVFFPSGEEEEDRLAWFTELPAEREGDALNALKRSRVTLPAQVGVLDRPFRFGERVCGLEASGRPGGLGTAIAVTRTCHLSRIGSPTTARAVDESRLRHPHPWYTCRPVAVLDATGAAVQVGSVVDVEVALEVEAHDTESQRTGVLCTNRVIFNRSRDLHVGATWVVSERERSAFTWRCPHGTGRPKWPASGVPTRLTVLALVVTRVLLAHLAERPQSTAPLLQLPIETWFAPAHLRPLPGFATALFGKIVRVLADPTVPKEQVDRKDIPGTQEAPGREDERPGGLPDDLPSKEANAGLWTVRSTRTVVTVEWQDGTVSRGVSSLSLVPADPDVGEAAVFPGDHVRSADPAPPTGGGAARVGVVQAVDVGAQMARVAWLADVPTAPVAAAVEASVYDLRTLARRRVLAGGLVACAGIRAAGEPWLGVVRAVDRGGGRLQVQWVDGGTEWVGVRAVRVLLSNAGDLFDEVRDALERYVACATLLDPEEDGEAAVAAAKESQLYWPFLESAPSAEDDGDRALSPAPTGPVASQPHASQVFAAAQRMGGPTVSTTTAGRSFAATAVSGDGKEYKRGSGGAVTATDEEKSEGCLVWTADLGSPLCPLPTAKTAATSASAGRERTRRLQGEVCALAGLASGARPASRLGRRTQGGATATVEVPQGLPAGVRVWATEGALDRVRFAVAGAAGTPYRLGFFEFEALAPTDYSATPPLVRFAAHGQRLHPNLYADGTVCLSLLGTWPARLPGEGWAAATSSLRQVVLSIQGLVLGDPRLFFAEPGREARRGDPGAERDADRAHEAAALDTMRHSAAAWLAPPHTSSTSAAVVRAAALAHLCERRPLLLALASATVDGITTDPALADALVELGFAMRVPTTTAQTHFPVAVAQTHIPLAVADGRRASGEEAHSAEAVVGSVGAADTPAARRLPVGSAPVASHGFIRSAASLARILLKALAEQDYPFAPATSSTALLG